MAEPRPETRVTTDFKLRVWGIGADGHAFFQQAQALNISTGGALLCGIEHELKVGEEIGLQHADRKARCQVVWAINTASLQKIKAGVKLLSGTPCPWIELLGSSTPPSTPENVRKWIRHKISLVIELHVHGLLAPLRVRATDISGNGCYAEALSNIRVGTSLNAILWLASDKMMTRSVVRTSDPGVGMGIEFVGLKLHERQRLQAYLEGLDPWSTSIAR